MKYIKEHFKYIPPLEIMIIKKDDGKRARFAYTLRQGVSLPYSPDRIGDRKC